MIVSSLATNLHQHYKRLWMCVLLLGALDLPCLGLAAPKQVLVLLSEDAVLYKEAANALREGLESEVSSGKLLIRTLVIGEGGLSAVSAPPDTLLVPLGAKATQATEHLDQAILAGLLSRQTYEKFFISSGHNPRRPVSTVYLDQPLVRHMQLVHALQPRAQSVGVLLGSAQTAVQPALLNAARASGLSLTSTTVNSGAEVFPALQNLLPNVDVLLLLPDPSVINRHTVQNLMLSAYRQHVPAVAYSQDLVQVGALAAVFSTPQQIGRQLAEIIQNILPGKNWDLPPPVYPKYFTINTNASVARALEINVPGEASLRQRMDAGSGL